MQLFWKIGAEMEKEKAGSAIICVNWLQISYLGISDKADWERKLHKKKEQDTDVVAAEGLCTALMPQQDVTPLSLHSCEELQSASGANSFLPCWKQQ